MAMKPFFLLLLIISFQNCSSYRTFRSQSFSLAALQKTCEGTASPDYRISLLSKIELGYVLGDLFPAEVAAQPAILAKISEFSDINVNPGGDGTIYSENNSGIVASEVYLLQLLELSQLLFSQFVLGASFKSDCTSLAGGCVGYYTNKVVAPLWRRPLISEEFAVFTEIFAKAITINEKVNLLFLNALTSPQFYLKNYLPKNGTQKLNYSQYYLASRLSFFLYNSVPDAELLNDAANGKLSDDEVLKAHVDRLLTKEPYNQRFVKHALAHWLQIDKDLDSTALVTNDKGLSLTLKEMAQQQFLMLLDIVKNDEGIAKIISGTELYMSKTIASFLGVDSTPFTTTLQRVPASLSNGLAASYLASPHFANRAKITPTDVKTMVTSRGKLVGKSFLCQPIPVNELDPSVVASVLGPDAANMTQIQVGNIRRNHVACMGCHLPIDTSGMGLEFVDSFGRLRSTYSSGGRIEINFEINTSEVRHVTDFASYLDSISKDERYHACFVKTIASRVAPTRLDFANPCAQEIAQTNLHQGIRSYVKSLVTHKLFKSAEVKL
jgi:hypothetical protein